MTAIKAAEAELQRITAEIKRLDHRLAGAPAGVLRCAKNGRYYKCFRVIVSPDGKKTTEYIKRRDKKLAQQLALKTMLTRRRLMLGKQAASLRTFISRYRSICDRKSTIEKMSPGFQALLADAPVIPDLAEELREWQAAPYKRSEKYPEHLTVSAVNRLIVRSKSEAYIAAVLTEKGIPFRYECERVYGSAVIYPDFTIRHPLSGRTYLWEHFGRIDKPGYLDDAVFKLNYYVKDGFIPGDNFIATFETETRPLSFDHVRSLIDYYFLS